MIFQVSPRGGCCELETHPTHDPVHPPLRKNLLKINNKSSFWCKVCKTFKSFDRCAKKNNKRNCKENRRGRLKNLKIKLKLKFLSIFYTFISIWKWRMIDSKKREQKKKKKKNKQNKHPKKRYTILPIYLTTISTFLQYTTFYLIPLIVHALNSEHTFFNQYRTNLPFL